MKVITDTKTPREKQARLSYLDNPAVVSLLDVIAENIAEEFIEKVRGNRDVFENPPQPAPSPRGEKEKREHPHLSSPLKGEKSGEWEGNEWKGGNIK